MLACYYNRPNHFVHMKARDDKTIIIIRPKRNQLLSTNRLHEMFNTFINIIL